MNDNSTFTASNGYKVDRLADGQTKITRATDGVFEAVTWCGGDEYLAIAEHAIARTIKLTESDGTIDDIRVENPDGRTAPVRIHIDRDLFHVGVGAIHVTRATAEKIRDELIAAIPLEIAPSDTDPTALSEQRIPLYAMLDIWTALYATSHPEFDEFHAKHGYAETWARLLAAVRTSQPVQVEVTDDMVERAEKVWWDARSTGQVSPMRAALSAALGGGE